MTSGGCEVDMGGKVQLPKQRTRLSVQALYRSFELQTLASSKLLVLIGKKHAFKFSTYIFEYQPPPPAVRLPRVHSRDECSEAFPVFHCHVYHCECKRKVKTGEAWEQR